MTTSLQGRAPHPSAHLSQRSLPRASWVLSGLACLMALGSLLLDPAFAATPSTLQLPSTTTAYTSGQFMATSATGTSVVIPSFSIQSYNNTEVLLTGGHLSINDTLASSWNGQTIQIDLWSSAPTFTSGNGDRSTFLPATGTAKHLGTLTCVLSSIYGDGEYAECSPTPNTTISIFAGSPTQVFWTAIASTGSGTVTASDVVSFTPITVH